MSADKVPILFGRRMRLRMRAHGVTGWGSRYGGISCLISHDPELPGKPWYWQIDAWTKRGCLSGRTRTQEQALAQMVRAIRGVVRMLPGDFTLEAKKP